MELITHITEKLGNYSARAVGAEYIKPGSVSMHARNLLLLLDELKKSGVTHVSGKIKGLKSNAKLANLEIAKARKRSGKGGSVKKLTDILKRNGGSVMTLMLDANATAALARGRLLHGTAQAAAREAIKSAFPSFVGVMS